MISRADIPHLRRAARSPRSAWHVARLLARYGRERLHAPRGTTLHLGNALAARLFKSALDLGVELRLGASVTQLLTAGGRVTGVELERAGTREHVLARKAVILASGGLSQDAALRSRYVPADGRVVDDHRAVGRREQWCAPGPGGGRDADQRRGEAGLLGSWLDIHPSRRHAGRLSAHRHRPRQARRHRRRSAGPPLRQRGPVVPRVRARPAASRRARDSRLAGLRPSLPVALRPGLRAALHALDRRDSSPAATSSARRH